MKIVYAAERSSIASLLAEHLQQNISPRELRISEDPGETGSFLVGWQFARFRLAPDGAIDPLD